MAKFKTSARTLDLLGRQQIAGIPTAINELFKNAHDAYADFAEIDYLRSQKLFILRDNGLGMTEEALENIMDPSSQTGLGIAVKNVNDRILGYFGEESFMKYASELGKGTRVTLYLKGCAENQPS